MKCRLDTTCDVRQGLLQVVDWQVAEALARIDRPTADRAGDVHAMRLAIKRLRAIWHLIGPSIDGEAAGDENARLREAARSLAGPRDFAIACAALDELLEEPTLPNQRAAILAVQDRLQAGDSPTNGQVDAVLRRVGPVLRQTLAALRCTTLTGDDWNALQPGLTRTITRLHRAYDRVESSGHDEDYHQWRKLIKRAHFQLELLRDAWPKRLGPMIKSLRDLGDKLGEDHDLFILRQCLSAPSPASRPSSLLSAPATIALVQQVIDAKSHRLRARCRQMWPGVLDGKPKSFLRRLEGRCRAWYSSPAGAPVAA
jgi:CHAD domain-containing protein